MDASGPASVTVPLIIERNVPVRSLCLVTWIINPTQHHQGRGVLEHIADCGEWWRTELIEPHQYSCDQEDRGAQGDAPKKYSFWRV